MFFYLPFQKLSPLCSTNVLTAVFLFLALRDLSFIRRGRAATNGGRVIKFYIAKKGEGHQKFKLGFGKGDTIFVNIAVHLK